MIADRQTILIVEDDAPVRNLIETTLHTQSYRYLSAENAEKALIATTSWNPDIILMDLGLPDTDGIDLIKKIRTWSVVPIIVISARSDDCDKTQALDAGADDYLTKPFSIEELLARLRAIIRRIQFLESKEAVGESVFHNGELSIDYVAAVVTIGEEEIHLMPLEYHLLCLFAKNVGKVLTHQYILEKVWGSTFESDLASLRVYMALLRKKIEVRKGEEGYIQTHIGIGYRMVYKQ